MKNRKWYSINAKADSAEILIYDVIGEDFWGNGVGAKKFVEDLNQVKASQINVRINSPGGDVYEGNAIYNALRMHKAKINVQIDGIAASIASVIAMAGDKIQIAENAMIMIHNPWTFALGNAAELRKVADTLDKAQITLLSSYKNKTGLTDDDLVPMLDAETWLTAKEALSYGFVDEILEPVKMAACSGWHNTTNCHYMLKAFKNLPEKYAAIKSDDESLTHKLCFARMHLELDLASIDAM